VAVVRHDDEAIGAQHGALEHVLQVEVRGQAARGEKRVKVLVQADLQPVPRQLPLSTNFKFIHVASRKKTNSLFGIDMTQDSQEVGQDADVGGSLLSSSDDYRQHNCGGMWQAAAASK
jgi:hypothetical protein